MGCKAEAASRGRSDAKPCGRQWATLFRHRFPQSGRSPAGLKPPAGAQCSSPSSGSRAISSRSRDRCHGAGLRPRSGLARRCQPVHASFNNTSIDDEATSRSSRGCRSPQQSARGTMLAGHIAKTNSARPPRRLQSGALRCAPWRGTICISQRVMCTITIIGSARVCFRKTTVQRSAASHLRRRIAWISRQIAVLRDVFDCAHREHRAFAPCASARGALHALLGGTRIAYRFTQSEIVNRVAHLRGAGGGRHSAADQVHRFNSPRSLSRLEGNACWG